jgi:hypothetical protein
MRLENVLIGIILFIIVLAALLSVLSGTVPDFLNFIKTIPQ